MNEEFYIKHVNNQINNTDFKAEQSEFSTRSKVIEEVQEQYKLYIDHYLQKDQKEWVDAPLFDLIDANWDQEKVITYIDYELKDNAHDLSKDDINQLKDLKTVLEKQDYKEHIYVFPNSVNFWILSGITRNKNWEENKIIMHNIKKLRKNRYKLLLQREWSKNIEKYEIHYDWSDYVSIYNQFWMRLWREKIDRDKTILINWNKYRKEQYQTQWKLKFNPSNNEETELDLVFVA